MEGMLDWASFALHADGDSELAGGRFVYFVADISEIAMGWGPAG